MTWILAAISLTATAANIYHQRWCFWLWLLTNLSWAVVDWQAGIYAQTCLHVMYAGLAVWGLIRWDVKDKS